MSRPTISTPWGLECGDTRVSKPVPTVPQKGGIALSPEAQKDEQPTAMAVAGSTRATFSPTHLWGRFFYSYDLGLTIGLHGSVIPPAKAVNTSIKVKDL